MYTATMTGAGPDHSYDRIVLSLNFLEQLQVEILLRLAIPESGASDWCPVYACTLQKYFLNAAQTAGPLSRAI